MDYHFWLPLLSTMLIGGVGTYYQYRAVKIAEQQKGKKSSQKPSWFWRYGQFIVMLIAVAVVWIPYLMGNNVAYHQYLIQWGVQSPAGVPPNSPIKLEQLTYVQVIADGHALLPYADKYKLGGVAFHYFGLNDPDDADNLQKSALHDIRDDPRILIVIPVNQAFRDEIAQHGMGGTNYGLILVPKDRTMDDFKTLRVAKQLGVQSLGIGAGPP
jgi:hypothetical protein